MIDDFVELDRRFLDVTTSDPDDDSRASMLAAIGNEKVGYSWSAVLKNDGVVILGTAGAGKTTEILNQARKLRADGKCAFVLRLESLCRGPISKSFSLRDDGGEASFKAWLKTDGEAFAFLDALDEARLPDAKNSSILNDALTSLSEGVGYRSKDLRIVLTTRPSEWQGAPDFRLLKTFLQRFKDVSRNAKNDKGARADASIKVFRIAPLDASDIRKLAESEQVDADRFLESINRGLSADIVRQPLDVEFLIEIWKAQINDGLEPEQIFRSRTRIFELFVRKRVRDENEEERRSDLDPVSALQAAEKLAAGLAISDLPDLTLEGAENTLNASDLLNNDQEGWNHQKLRQLLSTGLFQPSVAGRIRFAHRELRDYLAAGFFNRAISECGGSLDSIEPLIAKGLGPHQIPQSAEKVLGWLATLNPVARKLVTRTKPSLLIESGDPTSLSLDDRERTLRHHISQYDERQYRGEWFYHDDIKKIADVRLHPTISELLKSVESPEAMEFLLQVARYGQMKEISDVLAAITCDQNEAWRVRAHACYALLAVEDNNSCQNVLESALSTQPPEQEDADSAPNWNMFMAAVLRYCCATDYPNIEAIAVLSRFRREPNNYSSITPQLLIDFSSSIQDDRLVGWLAVLLRFASGTRNEQRHRLPGVNRQYKMFAASIAELTHRALFMDLKSDAKELVLDALEFLFQFDDDLSVFKRKMPLAELAAALRSKMDIKTSLIYRRILLFDPESHRDEVAFHVFNPIDFDQLDKAPSLFTLEDVQFHCSKMAGLPPGREYRRAFDIAWNCYSKMKEPVERGIAFEVLQKAAKRSSDKAVRKRCPSDFVLRLNRLKHNARYERGYRLNRKLRELKKTPRQWYWLIEDLWWFYRNQKSFSAGALPGPLLKLAKESPNDPGDATIAKIEERYGKRISRWCSSGYRHFWRKHNLLPKHANTYWEVAGLVGLTLDASSGPIKADKSEALKAFKFAYANLNGFLDWCEALAKEYPDVFTQLCSLRIKAAFEDENIDRQHTHNGLSHIAYSGKAIRDLLAPAFMVALIAKTPRNLNDLEIALLIVAQASSVPGDVLMPILTQGFESAFAASRISECWIWLDAIFHVEANTGWEQLVVSLGSDWHGAAASQFTEFLGRDRHHFSKAEELSSERIDLGSNLVVLRQLVRAAYLSCPPRTDPRHEEMYSPGIRDRASDRRQFYLDKLTGENSAEALAELDSLIADPDLTEFRNAFLYQRDELVRRSARRPTYSQEDTKLHLDGVSKAPSTTAEFRDLVRRHLSALLIKLRDSDDDESSVFRRGAGDEDDLRNWFAARLREIGDRRYSVTREQEVSKEKRPDLRIDARDASLGQIPVEMKLADKDHWTGKILLDMIETQLARQYLKEPASHSGFYMLVNASHPKEDEVRKGEVVRKRFEKKINRKSISFLELINRAEKRAAKVTARLPEGKVVKICWADLSVRHE